MAENGLFLGQTICKLRNERGLSQTDLGELAGLSQTHVSRLERGVHLPEVPTIIKIADALDVAPQFLLDLPAEEIPELPEVFNLIRHLTNIDMAHKSVFELLASTAEELGELARELSIEEASYGNTYKKGDEGTKAEAIDLAICAIAMFYARGGTLEEFAETATKKLAKWANNQSFPDSLKE